MLSQVFSRFRGCVALGCLALAACQSPLEAPTGRGGAGGTLGSSANAGCLDPATLPDRDLRTHAASIGALNLCVTERRFAAAGRDWLAYELASGRRGPLHVLPHDDEDAAFPIALHAMERFGGRMIALETGEARFVGGIDPNRYFANQRTSAAGCPHGAPDPAFASALLRGGGSAVFAYHSNDNGFAGDGRGGSGTISIRRSSASLRAFPAPAGGDEDDLVLFAGRSEAPAARTARTIGALNRAGVHALYEVVAAERDDCSLSNHLVFAGGPRYLNIEVGHGNVAAGRAMVDALAQAL